MDVWRRINYVFELIDALLPGHISTLKWKFMIFEVARLRIFSVPGTKIPPSVSSAPQTDPAPDPITVSVPRRVSWVSRSTPASCSQTDRRRRMPFKHLTRQRSFSLESQTTAMPKSTNLDISRKCVSLKSSPQISAHHVSTLPASFSMKSSISSSPLGVQKQSTPERSIMAELRRSSEIFKSILLNLSIKENDSVLEVVHSSTSSIVDNDVDVDNLMASHKQHCLENYRYFGDTSSSSSTSSTFSSRSSSPDRSSLCESELDEGEKYCKGIHDMDSATYLKVNSNIPPHKLGEMNETYGRNYLYGLPPLFLAVVRGNAIVTGLLMKYGANANFQVSTKLSYSFYMK